MTRASTRTTAVAHSKAVIAAHDFDELSGQGTDRPSLRWIVIHMIEAYSPTTAMPTYSVK